jgi:hypothetical protein
MVVQEQEPKEDFILIVDADNIMRFPFDPVELKVQPGGRSHRENFASRCHDSRRYSNHGLAYWLLPGSSCMPMATNGPRHLGFTASSTSLKPACMGNVVGQAGRHQGIM